MAEDKKGFILYADIIGMVNQLPDNKAGLLFKHILSYVNDENPISDDLIINISFEPIKASLKRDLEKYERIKSRNSLNGSKGGRPKKENPEEPKKPTGLFGNPKKPQKADSDTDSVRDSVRDSDNEIENKKDVFSFDEFWAKYPKKVEKIKCENKYKSLTDIEKQKIKDTIDYFVSYKPFKEYNHPHPSVYINNKRWDDELPNNKTKPKYTGEPRFKVKYRSDTRYHIHTEAQIKEHEKLMLTTCYQRYDYND